MGAVSAYRGFAEADFERADVVALALSSIEAERILQPPVKPLGGLAVDDFDGRIDAAVDCSALELAEDAVQLWTSWRAPRPSGVSSERR